MIRIHGPYKLHVEGIADGTPLRNEKGESWHAYVMKRVHFDDRGTVVRFFEDDGTTRITKPRWFGLVWLKEDSETIHYVSQDISRCEPLDRIVIETDFEITAGMRYVDGEILPALPVREEFNPISRKQFAYHVAKEKIITFDEALAWATLGTLPKVLVEILDRIPDEDIVFDAKMHLAASTQFERYHDLTSFIGYALGYTNEKIDSVWREAVNL